MSQCVLEQGKVVVLSCGVCLDSFAAPAYFLAPPKWFLSHLLGNRADDSHCSDRGQKTACRCFYLIQRNIRSLFPTICQTFYCRMYFHTAFMFMYISIEESRDQSFLHDSVHQFFGQQHFLTMTKRFSTIGQTFYCRIYFHRLTMVRKDEKIKGF